MKKLRDIFELPVTGVDVQGKDVYHTQPENDKIVDDAIAHAINHVDALADALGELLLSVTSAKKDESINNKIISAAKALSAYRGEK